MSQFQSFGLSPQVLRALLDEGYTTPTPIQSQAIPTVLEGRDLLGCAQTGTGKTAAFALPIIHLLGSEAPDKTRRGPVTPRALILSPTRELASQIGESFEAYGRHTNLRHAVIYGGVSQYRQEQALRRGVDVLVATPGRLIDLMQQGLMDFSRVRILVLDEADRMLDMGFIQPIRLIAGALTDRRQTLLFSATMPKPIMRLADSLMTNPVKVAVSPKSVAAPLIEQSVYMVQRHSKPDLLEHMLRESEIGRALVFTRTKRGADKLCKRLNKSGVTTGAIHGDKSQSQRERALAGFRAGRARVLVATDVAARGLDVDGITHVFNYDLPTEPEAYVHRIGRTGRAGAAGVAISFCDGEERGLLREIERLTGSRIDAITKLPDLPEPVRMEYIPAHGGDSRPAFERSDKPRAQPGARRGAAGRSNRGAAPAHANGRPARRGGAGPAQGGRRMGRTPSR